MRSTAKIEEKNVLYCSFILSALYYNLFKTKELVKQKNNNFTYLNKHEEQNYTN